MSNPRALVTTQPQEGMRDQLMYIVAQTSRAHDLEETLRKQVSRHESIIIEGSAREVPGEKTGDTVDSLAFEKAPNEERPFNQGTRLQRLRQPPRGTKTTTRVGQWHKNLVDISVAPFLIILGVLAMVIMPVYQGYTRLDLLSMVLSQDASLSIPPKQSQSGGGLPGLPTIPGLPTLPPWMTGVVPYLPLSQQAQQAATAIAPQATIGGTHSNRTADARALPVTPGYISLPEQDDMMGRVPWDE